MSYLELINRFWKIHESVFFSPHDISVYFYLLREANRQGWPEPFVCPNRALTLGLNISDMTLIRCRDRLAAHGVFEYKSAKDKRKPPIYYLNKLSRSVSRSVSRDVSRSVSRSVSRDVSINKDIKNIRLKNKSPIPPDKPGVSIAGLEIKTEKPKKAQPAAKPQSEAPALPTIDDVKAHFLAQHADTRLQDWEAHAEIFFNTFDATGWIDSNGRKIRRWDSRANRWILENEQKQTDEKRRRQAASALYDPRRGVDAGNPETKNWGSSF